jgi:plasmid stabilization system protein ParE
VPEFDYPEIREIIEPPYRILYRVDTARIDVLTVFHGARPFPGR